MMKRFFYTLIVCVAAMSQSIVLAALPIIPSTDTDDGAHWYRIRHIRMSTWELPAYIKASELGVNIGMGEFEEDSDNLLWCFVGNETDGFKIHNKAFLFNDARLTAVDEEGLGFIRLEEASAAWNYTWEFVSGEVAGNVLWGLRTDGSGSRSTNILHGWNNAGRDYPVIFYGETPDRDGYGCAWMFEDASLPVKPSLPILPFYKKEGDPEVNTVEHLDWYRIKNVRHASGPNPPYMKADELGVNIGTAHYENSNNVLWCFIGTASEGYQIYNRAFLDDKARVIGVDTSGELGFIQLATDDVEWNYSWEFMSAVVGGATVWGLGSEGGRGGKTNILHGWDHPPVYEVIFYGGTSDDGCAWEFETPTEVPVNFKVLAELILECTEQVEQDKLDAYNVEFYGEGIDIFEEAIAAAQDVMDNPEATQPDVNLAVTTLKKARVSYGLSYVDLPFEVSKDGTWSWYKIINERRDNGIDSEDPEVPPVPPGSGYWTYDPIANTINAIAEDDSDSQLWAFTGNNFTGINIYNKANEEEDARLINLDGFGLSPHDWDGVWKIDSKIEDGANVYSIVNINGAFNESANKLDNYIHTLLGGGLFYYGFSDDHGSCYRFEFVTTTTTSIQNVSKDAMVVYAQDGNIYVKGTESKAAIYSLTGGLLAVFDAQKPFTAAVKGVYIVQINNKAYKVVVQ